MSCRAASPRVRAVTPRAAAGTWCPHGSSTLSPRVVHRKCHWRTVQEGTRAAFREGTGFSCFHLYHPAGASRLPMWMMPVTATPPFASDHMAGAALGKCWGVTELLPCLLQAPVLRAHRAVPGIYHYVPLCCAQSSTAPDVREGHCQGSDIFGTAGCSA